MSLIYSIEKFRLHQQPYLYCNAEARGGRTGSCADHGDVKVSILIPFTYSCALVRSRTSS